MNPQKLLDELADELVRAHHPDPAEELGRLARMIGNVKQRNRLIANARIREQQRLDQIGREMAGQVERYRVNDYVGPAIWGFRTSATLCPGDQVYYDDHLFTERDGKPFRSYYHVSVVDGRPALLWDNKGQPGAFAGFLHQVTR